MSKRIKNVDFTAKELPVIEPKSRTADQNGPVVSVDGLLKEFLGLLNARLGICRLDNGKKQ
jgi:hypothetical protein